MNHASYILSAYSSLKNLTLDQLLQVGIGQTEDPNPIPSFDENLLINLCIDTINIISREDNIIEIDGDTFVVGDIHGSFHDLLRILNYIEPNPSKVVFLGDYVDRGCFSLECITLLFALKVIYPNKFYLLRGNHEFDAMCSEYGFKKEILNYHNPKKMTPKSELNSPTTIISNSNSFNFDEEEKKEDTDSHETLCDKYYANHINMNCYKYTEKLYNSFMKAFSYLPIAALVNRTTFCIHGGLSPLLDRIERISTNIQRPIENIDTNLLLTDLLWGDPSSQCTNFFSENQRGRGKLFNGVSVVNFLKNNFLTRIIRAHQCVKNGVEEDFNQKCITVFSASSYDKNLGNMSGILKLFHKKDIFEAITFDPISRLKKHDAVYYKVQAFYETKPSKPVLFQFNLKSISSCGYMVDHFPKSSRETDNFTFSSDLSDSDADPENPAQPKKINKI